MGASFSRCAVAGLLVLGLAGCGDDDTSPSPGASTAADYGTGTKGIVAAATAFLSTLSSAEKDSVLFDRGDKTQQQRWSNLPEGLYQRQGLMLGDLDESKTEAFLAVMRTTLSTEGYHRVMAEWAADDALAAGGSGGASGGPSAAGGPGGSGGPPGGGAPGGGTGGMNYGKKY
jgi:uncharacterized protein DUF3500